VTDYVVAGIPNSVGGKGTPSTHFYAVDAESPKDAVVKAHTFARFVRDNDIERPDAHVMASEETKEKWVQQIAELGQNVQANMVGGVNENGITTVKDDAIGGYTVSSVTYSVSEMMLWNPQTVREHARVLGIAAAKIGDTI